MSQPVAASAVAPSSLRSVLLVLALAVASPAGAELQPCPDGSRPLLDVASTEIFLPLVTHPPVQTDRAARVCTDGTVIAWGHELHVLSPIPQGMSLTVAALSAEELAALAEALGNARIGFQDHCDAADLAGDGADQVYLKIVWFGRGDRSRAFTVSSAPRTAFIGGGDPVPSCAPATVDALHLIVAAAQRHGQTLRIDWWDQHDPFPPNPYF